MYTRGIWITPGREARFTKVYDVLWMGLHIEMKPCFFIWSEDDEYLYGIGYGEGQKGRAVSKSEIVASLVYPSLLMKAGDSINFGALM